MIKAHILSDFYLGIIEPTDNVDETLPDCDLVFIAGNLGHIKREMIYVEKMCRKYPNKQFILNIGRTEGTGQKNNTELVDGLTSRQLLSEFWPKNLHYAYQKPIKLTINEQTLDILCLHGYPNFIEKDISEKEWKSSSWWKYASHGVTFDQNEFRPTGTSDVYHGWFPKVSNVERCIESHALENAIVQDWLNNKESGGTKVLVTALNPIEDPCLPKLKYEMYPGANPDIWIAGGKQMTVETNSYRLYSNPGRAPSARESVFTI